MAKKYMTEESSRAVVIISGLERERDAQLEAIRISLEHNWYDRILWRVNALRAISDLLDRPKGRAIWYNTNTIDE